MFDSKKIAATLFAVAGLSSINAHASGVNLIQNGGFETGNLNNWISGGGSFDVLSGANAHSGNYYTENLWDSGSTLRQSVAVTSSGTYNLSFYLEKGPGTTDAGINVNYGLASNPTQVLSISAGNIPGSWTLYNYSIKAISGTSLAVQFNSSGGTLGNGFFYIDDVSIIETAVSNSTPILQGAQANTMVNIASATESTINNRLDNIKGGAYYGTSANNHLWIAPYSALASQSGNAGADGFSTKTFGVAFGGDHKVYDKNTWLGAAFSIGHSNIHGENDTTSDRLSMDNYTLSLYGKHKFDNDLETNIIASSAEDRNHNDREDINFGYTQAKYQGWHSMLSTEILKPFNINEDQTISPLLRTDLTHVAINSYTDSSGLMVDSQMANSLVFSVGTKYSYQITTNGRLLANATIGYDPTIKQASINAMAPGGTWYNTKGLKPGSEVVHAGIGYELALKKDTSISIHDDYYSRGNNYISNMASLTAKWMF